MTGEEMERAMELILHQQARFEASAQAKMEWILDQQAKFSAEMTQIKELGGELAKSQVRMQNALVDLAESHRKLAESQQETEKRLQSALKALERGFGGNGRGRKTS